MDQAARTRMMWPKPRHNKNTGLDIVGEMGMTRVDGPKTADGTRLQKKVRHSRLSLKCRQSNFRDDDFRNVSFGGGVGGGSLGREGREGDFVPAEANGADSAAVERLLFWGLVPGRHERIGRLEPLAERSPNQTADDSVASCHRAAATNFRPSFQLVAVEDPSTPETETGTDGKTSCVALLDKLDRVLQIYGLVVTH
jgi:hypothetical protein